MSNESQISTRKNDNKQRTTDKSKKQTEKKLKEKDKGKLARWAKPKKHLPQALTSPFLSIRISPLTDNEITGNW